MIDGKNMRRYLFLGIILMGTLLNGATPGFATKTCGDEGLTCGEGQRCCEHTVGTFCANQQCGYTYVKGQCVDASDSCGDFWCGNRRCNSSWLNTKTTCCIYQD